MSEEWIGKTISKVLIQRKLSRGGMAEVYLGRHSTLDRPVAVKILHGYLADDEGLRQRTQQEARAIATLRHLNIVQVLDFDIAAGRPYIVMELLEGISLADYLKSHHEAGLSLPLPRITAILNQLASALDYAHQNGIVHRDIKPSNVMLRKGQTPLRLDLPLPEDAQAVLTDFGIARISYATSHTADGSVLGTPYYMSPEQINGGEIDSRSDIYSLGIMAYEMLAGSLPFGTEDDTPAAILYKQVHEVPPPIPNTDPGIQQVVFRALAKQKDDRFESAGAFARALELAVAEPGKASARTVVAKRRKSFAGLKLPDRRFLRPALIAVAGVALITTIYLGARAILGDGEESLAAKRPPDSATATSAPASGAAATEAVALTAAEPAFTIEGSLHAVNASLTLEVTAAQPGSPDEVRIQLVSLTGDILDLGQASFASLPTVLRLEHPEGETLLGTFERLVLIDAGAPAAESRSLFEHTFSATATERFNLLNQVAGDVDQPEEVLQGIQAQVSHYESHLGFALDSMGEGNLTGARSHAEHVINILSGLSGEFYGDWNGNELIENPGDDVGLLVYLELLDDLLQGPLRSNNTPARETAEAVHAELGTLHDEADLALSLARQIALADSVDVILELGIDQEIRSLVFSEQLRALADSARQLELAFYEPL